MGSDPVFITAVAAGICGIFAWAFMVVFDTVTDTILYCFATDIQGGGARESVRDPKEDKRANEQSSSARSCFFGGGRRPNPAEQSDDSGGRPEHAPPELRRLLDHHH